MSRSDNDSDDDFSGDDSNAQTVMSVNVTTKEGGDNNDSYSQNVSESSTTTMCGIAPRSRREIGNEERFFKLEHCIWAEGYWRLQ